MFYNLRQFFTFTYVHFLVSLPYLIRSVHGPGLFKKYYIPTVYIFSTVCLHVTQENCTWENIVLKQEFHNSQEN